MKARLALALIFAAALLVLPHTAWGATYPWEIVAPGVEYQEFAVDGPNNVFVTRMDRHYPGVTLDSGLANGRLGGGMEIVSRMAGRYDQAVNFWTQPWGTRNRVVAAINGSYFGGDGLPQSGQVVSGWYAKRFDDYSGGSGLAWTLDRSLFIGGCVSHTRERQTVTDIGSGSKYELSGVNVLREPDGLFLYTPQYGVTTGTLDKGVEVLVELTRPAMIVPKPAYINGFVRQVRPGQGSTLIPFDHVVLSARGAAADWVRANLEAGDEIGISQEVTDFDNDTCKLASGNSWTKTYASISGHFIFLNNGKINGYEDNAGATARHPRTAMAYNDEFVFFIVADGRSPGVSVGMSIRELAAFAKNQLGATHGIAQDGGGSSTLYLNGYVKNQPSDPCNRVFLPLMGEGKSGSSRAAQAVASTPNISPTCERRVVNGMFMVVLEPAEFSKALKPGDRVTARAATNVWLGPGMNYPAFTSLPAGTKGEVLNHINGLNGVLAKGAYWWKVSFGGVEGWVPEWTLAKPTSFATWLFPWD